MPIFHMNNKLKLKRKQKHMAAIAFLLLLFAIWVYYGNVTVGVTAYRVSSPALPQALDGFAIAQVSDLHNAEFGDNQARLINTLAKAGPDIIVVTGDLIDSRRTDIGAAMAFIRQAVELAPVYYVTGNHEARLDQAFPELEADMLAAGVQVLRDDTILLEKSEEAIQLIGLDDPAFSREGSENWAAGAMATEKPAQLMTTDTYTVLLSHRPELFTAYTVAGVDLALTGHAHGGQIRLPFIGGLIAPDQGFLPQYTAGSFESGHTTMIVSRGLGNSLFPFRVNNPPEIVLVTLKHE